MFKSILLLTSVLSLGQPLERTDGLLTPQLVQGLELAYTGTYLEESLIPNVRYQRLYKLEASAIVLESAGKDWQLGCMTSLSLQDNLAGNDKNKRPTYVQLGILRVDQQGRVRTLDKKPFEIPIKSPPTLECGFFAPVPSIKLGPNSTWDVGDAGQPAQHWQFARSEPCGGVTCFKLTNVQQSSDWDSPRADRTAWRRRDFLWVHPQLHVAQKVERIIERRDPAREEPTQRSFVRYELQSQIKYPSLMFDEYRKDFNKAIKFQQEAQPLVRQPIANHAQIVGLLQRVSYHLEHQPQTQATPYRKAIVSLQTVLENAKKGDAPAPLAQEDPPAPVTPSVQLGQRAPDFAVSSLTEERTTQLKNLQGKPIIVFFYNPATSLGKEVVTYVKRLHEQHSGKVSVMAMAITQDVQLAKTQHKDMRLPFPLLDGNGLRLTFGAEQTPRFAVLDSDGVLRLAETGWGLHTTFMIEDALDKCLKK